MPEDRKKILALTGLLAFIGGFTDGTVFRQFGIFCGHLTGNSVLCIVQLARGEVRRFFLTAAVMAAFCAGVWCGTVLCGKVSLRRYGSVAGLLSACLILAGQLFGGGGFADMLCGCGCGFSLGMLNAVARNAIAGKTAVSYITGTTISLVEELPGPGGSRSGDSRRSHVLTVAGFLAGAGSGVALTCRFGVGALSFPALAFAVLFFWFIQAEKKTEPGNFSG